MINYSRIGRKFLCVSLSLFLMVQLFAMPAAAQENPEVQNSMKTLLAELAALGTPKLEGEDLYFGTTKVNGDYTVVDAVKAKHDGTATLFAKQGTNFVRVSTNVMKDGNRAVGSILDPAGPAYAAINTGKPFYGLVDILGKLYDTGYEPIKDEAGNVIGIAYVGYMME